MEPVKRSRLDKVEFRVALVLPQGMTRELARVELKKALDNHKWYTSQEDGSESLASPFQGKAKIQFI